MPLQVVLGGHALVAKLTYVVPRYVPGLDVTLEVTAGGAVVTAALAPVRPGCVPHDEVLQGEALWKNRVAVSFMVRRKKLFPRNVRKVKAKEHSIKFFLSAFITR